MSWDRKKRLDAVLREKISVVVTQRLRDPRLGFVTITGAELSPDKRRCTVNYTVIGDDSQQRMTQRALEAAAPHVLEVIGPSLRIRHLPELRFVFDAGQAKGARVLELLGRIAQDEASLEDAGVPVPEAAPEEPGLPKPAKDSRSLASADDEDEADEDDEGPRAEP